MQDAQDIQDVSAREIQDITVRDAQDIQDVSAREIPLTTSSIGRRRGRVEQSTCLIIETHSIRNGQTPFRQRPQPRNSYSTVVYLLR